jgi:PAS domain S-box-containing protein
MTEGWTGAAALGLAASGIVDQLDVAVILCDLESRIVVWNRHAEAVYGYAQEEALGRSVLDLTMPQGATGERAELAETVVAGRAFSGNVVAQRRDGTPVIVDLRITPWLLENGERAGAIGVSFDVTERALAERRLDAHSRLARSIAAEESLDAAASELLWGVAEAMLIRGGTMWAVDDGDLRHVATVPEEAPAPVTPRHDRLVREAIEQRALAVSDDRASLAYAIANGRREVIGVVELELRSPAEDRVVRSLLPPLGRQFAQYADRRAGEAELRRSEERFSFLADASSILADDIDYNATLAAVARAAVPRLADLCLIDLVDADGQIERVFVADEDAERHELARALQLRSAIRDPRTLWGVATVVRTGEPRFYPRVSMKLIDESTAELPEAAELLKGLGLRSLIVVPLTMRTATLGALTLMTTADSGRRYDDDDLVLAVELGRRAGLAVEKARLYAAQRATLYRLQSALLPQELPIIPGAGIAARYRPGSTEAEIGGDFYDVFQVGEGSWMAVIGDVSGKGTDAASQASLVRHTLKASALIGARPSEILSIVNRAMEPETGEGWFATLVCARIDARAAGGFDVSLARAGHPTPVVVRAAGPVEQIDVGGMPVGFAPTARYEEMRLELAPGDKLVLYTDGVSESRRDGVLFGEEGVLQLAAANASDAETLARALEHESTEYGRGMTARDDLATLVVAANGPDELDRTSLSWRAAGDSGAVDFRVNLVLPRDPLVAGYVRRVVDELADDLPASSFADAKLLVCELVTNAITHAPTNKITVELLRTRLTFRATVGDEGDGFDVERPVPPPQPEASSGYGLYLIEQLAHRFGVARGGLSRVWFELSLSDAD